LHIKNGQYHATFNEQVLELFPDDYNVQFVEITENKVDQQLIATA